MVEDAQIVKMLKDLESQYSVKIIYACESGSRAWGFPSLDSDYDIRFIYVHDPDWYMSVFQRRDVIETPIEGDIDLGGWDIRKSLALLRKSNCALFEWLSSPVVYLEDNAMSAQVKALIPGAFMAASGCHHYLSMAHRKLTDITAGRPPTLKAYFYALRATLCAKFIADHGSAPPMLIDELLKLYIDNEEQLNAIKVLLEDKRLSHEGELVNRVDWLDALMQNFLKEVKSAIPANQTKGPLKRYDEVFRYVVREVWR